MRRTLSWSVLLFASAALLLGARAHGGDKKEEEKGSKEQTIKGELSRDDPIDKRTKHPSKMHKVELTKDKVYRIDMRSTVLDSFLLLEDPFGGDLAFDYVGCGFPNPRIIHKGTVTGGTLVVS